MTIHELNRYRARARKADDARRAALIETGQPTGRKPWSAGECAFVVLVVIIVFWGIAFIAAEQKTKEDPGWYERQEKAARQENIRNGWRIQIQRAQDLDEMSKPSTEELLRRLDRSEAGR